MNGSPRESHRYEVSTVELVIRSLTLVGRSEQRASSPLSPDACLTEDGERESYLCWSPLLTPPTS